MLIKGPTPFEFGKIYSVIVVSCGNKCFNKPDLLAWVPGSHPYPSVWRKH